MSRIPNSLNLAINRHTRERKAFSLLEMVMAATLVVGTLVPTMTVMRDAMAKSRDLNRRNLLSNYAVSVLENQASVAIKNWTNTTATGNFAADGHPNIRYSAFRSDTGVNGGISNQLMHIQVTVFDDFNNDTLVSANELNVIYRTKVARLQSYDNEE